ncbi:MAG: RnfABCDGE type electron transport complex subunit B [Oscillospiraceae bacterium]|nr:RnfABCDGE type electron transport complex subunit B [Oscillospiraceae bacterium]
MEQLSQILIPVLCLAAIGGVLGLLLAIAGRKFAVKVDEKTAAVRRCLPGANCGGCGYAGCDAAAHAIAREGAKISICTVCGDEELKNIAEIMGVKPEKSVRYRAQVMCSGTPELSKKKYIYDGVSDCRTAVVMGGGDKICPNGCVGLGSCVKSCVFEAISIVNGVAVVDYEKCRGCGTCVATCPKHIIRLMPYDSTHWVGCCSVDKGAVTRTFCEVGCIGCRKCEKTCGTGAIKVDGFIASIDYDKCIDCGACAEVCPRHIIWSEDKQGRGRYIIDPSDLKASGSDA